MLYICVRTYADGKYINMVLPRIFTNYHECIEMCIDLQQKLGQESDERWIPFSIVSRRLTRTFCNSLYARNR